MPTIRVPDPDQYLADLRARGVAVTASDPPAPARTPAEREKRAKPTVSVRVALVVGCSVPSTANGRDWRERDAAVRGQRQAVRRAFRADPTLALPFARHLAAGGTVRLTLTRLGGRGLDRRDNLPGALKGCLDEVFAWLGPDDGSAAGDRIETTYDQEPGGPFGVRVVLEIG